MTVVRNTGLIVAGIGCVLVVLSPRRRILAARKLTDARRFVSRRVVDEDARTSSNVIDTWEDQVGGMHAPSDLLPPAT